jgi:hypothetical protein
MVMSGAKRFIVGSGKYAYQPSDREFWFAF